jgi:MoxR-like ATPase
MADEVIASDEQVRWFAQMFQTIQANVEQVIRGKSDAVRLALTCVFAEGHLLIEDVPGTGKTSLAKAISHSIDGSWHRIQFTPDLLPSDVTGVTIFNQGTRTFEFHPGPVFANVVLADEINRASPKTQSSLLEVMEEQQVTVDSMAHVVPRPFVVIATQNPIEHDGTYELPEAQLDRFLMRMTLGAPGHDDEVEVLQRHGAGSIVGDLRPAVSAVQALQMIALSSRVHVAAPVQSYIVRIARATREAPELRLGVSTRGCLALQRAARSWAAASGRTYVNPDDVKALAEPVLAHRMLLTPDAERRGVRPVDILDRVLDLVEPPVARTR